MNNQRRKTNRILNYLLFSIKKWALFLCIGSFILLTTVVGDFIFSSQASGVFIIFIRKFGGLLKDFNINLSDIIRLSRFDRKHLDLKLYPNSMLII